MQKNFNLTIEGLTEEDCEWLQTNGKERRVSINEKLIREGEIQHEIYFILSGLFSIGVEKSEHFLAVGPGSVVGTTSFLTKQAAFASVTALEPNSVVLVVSRESISNQIKDDQNFAIRFYQMAALFLSKSLTNLVALFVTGPRIEKLVRRTPPLVGPLPLFVHDQVDFNLLRGIVDTLPPISELFKGLQQGHDVESKLIEREKKLSVATLTADTMRLLFDVAKEEGVTDLERRIISHQPSITSAEKQVILPDFQIQKTLTILIGDKFVLCSHLGSFNITHSLLTEIANKLDMAKGSFNSYINPLIFIPEIELGLLRGMVSTFFSPGRITQLSLVTLITQTSTQMDDVAVSLSPFESILLPCGVFPAIVKKYAQRAYPYLPFIELSI